MPIIGQTTATIAGLLGVVYAGLAVWLTPIFLQFHGRVTALGLSPSRERALELRVARLAETRSDTLDAQAAELRRIERDLHDGAQARLVAMGMGMTLGTIAHLMDRDPEKARSLLAETRESSSKALTELRDLVRGIHPPVLAEHGTGLRDIERRLAAFDGLLALSSPRGGGGGPTMVTVTPPPG